MLISKIEMHDYGPYQGLTKFEMAPKSTEHPIVLVSGENGAGKTTLFESIMLCLYGIASMNGRKSQKTYEEHLASKVHKSTNVLETDGAFVSVTFQISHLGKIQKYKVTRQWDSSGKSEQMILHKVKEDDQLEDIEMDTEHWQSFIDGLVPQSLVRMFFFDAEKLTETVNDETSVIKSSIDALFGLDIVNQLRKDLDVNVMRNAKGNNKQTQAEFDKLSKEKADNDERIGLLYEKQVSKNTEIDSEKRELQKVESTINLLGGEFSTKRDKLVAKKQKLEQSAELLSTKLREICAYALPFAIIPKQCQEIVEQINKDREITTGQLGHAAVGKTISHVKETLKGEEFWKGLEIKSTKHTELESRIVKIMESMQRQESKTREFDLSYMQEDKILRTIDMANKDQLRNAKTLSKQLNEIEEELHKVDTAIASAPKDDEIGPLMKKIGSIQSNIGMLDSEIDHIEQEMSALRALTSHLQVKIRKLLAELYDHDESNTRVNLTKKIQAVLDDYTSRLLKKKLATLETNIVDACQSIMHKSDFVCGISIDSQTYSITPLDQDGNTIDKEEMMSKGEQQMFATAILLGIARTSNRTLPFIVDTPMARLDKEHKARMLTKVYPSISHQVIIFSTDSEIDPDKASMLDEYVSLKYSINYLSKEHRTVVESKEMNNEVVCTA